MTETPAHAVYRIDPASGAVTQVLDDIAGPNGLCFSPDEKPLHAVESRPEPSRRILTYLVGADGTLSNNILRST